MKKIILFGSGLSGKNALDYFGKDNVFAFCDNLCKEEIFKYGVRVIPYYNIKDYISDKVIVISTNINNTGEIMNQLLFDGIDDFLIYNSQLTREADRIGVNNFVSRLSDNEWRNRFEKLQHIKMRMNAENQLLFLRKIADIKTLKKAKGYLYNKQKRLSDFAATLFRDLAHLDIKPFVAEGTALGLYRHGGFIPWDDDLDFGLFRDDYMKLMDYCVNNFKVLESSPLDSNIPDIDEILKKYPNEYIITLHPDEMTIRRGVSYFDSSSVDFFSYDFYADDYDFEKHREKIEECRNIVYSGERGNSTILSIIREYEFLRTDSSKIYFGLDNMNGVSTHIA